MSGKVLYRKYRPTKLEDVVGQSQVTDALANRIKQGNIGHAYLFIGPRGTGKTSVARIFAHAVNDFDYQVEDSYLDIIEIDAASNTGVDNIRELREKSVIAPTKGKYKVYIIDEIHMLTKSASNALLKTLEEPPEHVIFIMATTDAHKVPITISSRTQVFTFKLADSDTMFTYLRKIADLEKIPIDDEALRLVVRRGGGSFRDSMSLLDQVTTLTSDKITADLLSQALGLPQDQIIQELLESYTISDITKIQQLLKDLLNTGIKPEIIASELITHIIESPQPAWLPLLNTLPDVQPPFPEARLLVALLGPLCAHPAATAISSPAQSQATQTAPIKKPTPPKAKPAIAPKSAPVPDPVPTAEEAPEEKPTAPSDPGDFDWDTFLAEIHDENSAIYQQLLKTEYELNNDTLHIYPTSKFVKTILEKPNNNQIIIRHLHGLTFTVHDLGDRHTPKDQTLSQISDIMGGDIREITGDTPF